MRHVLANLVTYALVLGLVLGSALFAWVRSEQLVIAKEADIEPTDGFVSAEPAEALAFGERVYLANCQNCHTGDGSGRSMYPPVQNQAAHLGVPGGRGYLLDVTLYGLYTGTYGAPMPPMPELSNAEIAASTNYILTRFAAEGARPEPARLYTPDEVAERRGRSLSEREVAATRPPIPSAEELGRGVRPALKTKAPAVPEGEDR